jgi:ankyrin repeat protein
MWAAYIYRDLGNRDIGEGRESFFSPDLPLLHVLARYDLARVIDHLFSIASPDALDPYKIANRILERIPDLDVNRKDSFGHSALWMSTFWQSEATAILLLDVYQADVNVVDHDGIPLLHHACQTGNETIIRAIFKTAHNLEVEAKDSDGRTALMKTIRSGIRPIADLLISFGADLWTQDSTKYTTLHEAVRSGWEEMVKTLLDAGLSPQARSVDGWTPLHEVSQSKSLSILKMFLEKGGDIHSENIDGLQIFHEAVRGDSREDVDQLLFCEELIRLGCLLEKKAWGGWTPLHLASSAGSPAVVEL